MVFPTLSFVLFFILVLSLNGWAFGRAMWRKSVLLFASFAFYAAWDVRFLALMAAVIAAAYLGGRAARLPHRQARLIQTACIAGLLGLLGLFKYFNFFMLSLAGILEGAGLGRDIQWMQIILPVGISFYVFQAISYVVDCARGKIAPHGLGDVALYVSFFPQLVAGPIVRAADFLPQLQRPRPPFDLTRAVAVLLILSGMAKKMLIANYIATLLVDPVFARPELQTTLTAWVAVLGYSVQIFCDFSGYSDIAIGTALLLGYRFRANFNQPYRAPRFRAFWQRWHISLSSWIRDYLYIPLGGAKGGQVRQAGVMLAVMGLAGLWHGAAWTFVIWGLGHGALILLERLMGLSTTPRTQSGIWLGRVVVFGGVTLLWLPFRAENWPLLGDMVAVMLGDGGEGATPLIPSVLVLIAAGLAINYVPAKPLATLRQIIAKWPPEAQAAMLATGLFTLFAAAQDGTAPFIYFQF